MENNQLKMIFNEMFTTYKLNMQKLFGYKIILGKSGNSYKLIPEGVGDENYFLFESDKNQLSLLGTDYTSQFTSEVKEYLENYNSIPAFFSKCYSKNYERKRIKLV